MKKFLLLFLLIPGLCFAQTWTDGWTPPGTVSGPSSTTDNNLPQWDGTDGKKLKDGYPVSATPGSGTVPVADGSGKIDGWVSNASETVAGKSELATNAETVTGTDTGVVTTPANITARLAAPGAIGVTTPAAGTFTTLTGTDGIINKPAKTVSSTPVTLTESEIRNGIVFITTGASVINLPDASETYDGACVTFRDFTGVAFSINPDDSDIIDLNGTAIDAGDKITSSGVAGEEVTLVYDSTGTKWRTIQMNGVFTDGGA
jgi:hypothetical protein